MSVGRRPVVAAIGLGLATPHVRTAHAAGRLSIGAWDHFIPGANDALGLVCREWAAQNAVDLTFDILPGNKMYLMHQAEARSRTGHDIYATENLITASLADAYAPVGDIVAEIERESGPASPMARYMGSTAGDWFAVPATVGSHVRPLNSRLDLFRTHCGLRLDAVFPGAGQARQTALTSAFTWEALIRYAEKLKTAGFPVGFCINDFNDADTWLGPLFRAFGAQPVAADGTITLDSPQTREVLDYAKRLAAHMPRDIYAWDNSSNNKAIIGGTISCTENPPSPWKVALRDNPKVGEQLWHHDLPAGPRGRFRTQFLFFWTIWKFSPNKTAAMDLLRHLTQRSTVARLVTATGGYDVPPYAGLSDLPIWAEAGPPVGTIYNHVVRGDEQLTIAGYPAPLPNASKIYNNHFLPNLVGRVTQGGMSSDAAIAWGVEELGGYARD